MLTTLEKEKFAGRTKCIYLQVEALISDLKATIPPSHWYQPGPIDDAFDVASKLDDMFQRFTGR